MVSSIIALTSSLAILRLRDDVDDLVVERIGEPGQLALEFGAGFGAGVFFIGAFEFANLHVIGL